MATKYRIVDAIERARTDKQIGRSMVFSVCDGHCYVDGEPFDYTDTLLGNYSAERATRYLRKEMDDPSITIVHVTVYKQYCAMDLMDFWLEARATSDPVIVTEHFINK